MCLHRAGLPSLLFKPHLDLLCSNPTAFSCGSSLTLKIVMNDKIRKYETWLLFDDVFKLPKNKYVYAYLLTWPYCHSGPGRPSWAPCACPPRCRCTSSAPCRQSRLSTAPPPSWAAPPPWGWQPRTNESYSTAIGSEPKPVSLHLCSSKFRQSTPH